MDYADTPLEDLRKVASACNAFWEALGSQYPDIPDGDLPPEAHTEFVNAAHKVARAWLDANRPRCYRVTLYVKTAQEFDVTDLVGITEAASQAGTLTERARRVAGAVVMHDSEEMPPALFKATVDAIAGADRVR